MTVKIKQSTFNLIIIMAVAVIAAGAWSTPMLVVQTGHTLAAEIDIVGDNINEKIDFETGELDEIFGVTGGFDEAGCTIADMMAAFATDTDIGVFCDEDLLDSNFIKASGDFAVQSTQFDVENEILINSKGTILPFRDCDDAENPPNALQDSDADLFAGKDNDSAEIAVNSGAASGQFGAPTCLHTLGFADNPTILQTVTIEGGAAARNVRIQVAIIIDGDQTAQDAKDCLPTGVAADDEANFNANVIFDATVFAGIGERATIPAHFMGAFPPDDLKNVCVRIADEGNAQAYNVWLTVRDEGIPILGGVFEFIPQASDAFFFIDQVSFADFGDTCGLIIQVQDAVSNAVLPGVPVSILDPFIPNVSDSDTTPNDNTTDDQKVTDGAGQVTFRTDGGAGEEDMPSAFYIIDVNVSPLIKNDGSFLAGSDPIATHSFAFPDQFLDCTDDKDGATGDATLTVLLQPIGSKDIIVTAFNSAGPNVAGVPVNIVVSPFFGASVTTSGSTDATGKITFSSVGFGSVFVNINNSAAFASSGVNVNTGFSATTEFSFIDQFSPNTTFIGGLLVPQD